MKQKSFSFLLFVSFSACVLAQNKSFDSVISGLQKDQLFFEKVFIHTNKSEYNNDDTIWFKAYVSSNENKPSLKTTLLYVSLFSSYGEWIDTKNVFIHQGVGVGQFEIFDALESGEYVIQAHTNYMRNFGKENKFVTKIKIGKFTNRLGTSNKTMYDVQLFPEGGYLLENVKNSIAIKVLIDGEGSDFSGSIIDSKEKEITQFKNEHLGMGKSEFYYMNSENYQAIIHVNDTIITIDVPKANKEGMSLKIEDDFDKVNIQLQTNSLTLQAKEEDYFILFHQNNKLIDYADVVLKDTSKIELKLDKTNFYNGVNTVTIFKNKTPILERKFFVYKHNNKKNLELNEQTKEADSIVFILKMKNNLSPANLSVSVLSGKLNHLGNTNIESAFLLTPYLKGYIETPSYYFNEANKNRFKQIDLLMLTQGWTLYTASKYMDFLNPKYKFDFEIGYKLTGKLSPLASNSLVLISNKNEIIDKIFLNNKLDFTFKNLLIFQGDSVKVSFIKPNQELVKPKSVLFDTFTNVQQKLKGNVVKINHSFIKVKSDNALVQEDDVNMYQNKSTKLDTVNLSGKTISKSFLKKKKLVDKYKDINFDIGKYMPLEVDENYKQEHLLNYLSKKEGVTLKNWNGIEWYLAVGVGQEAILYVDGERITNERFNGLNIEMSEIESLMMQPIGRGNRAYQVFTTSNYQKGIVELYNNYVFNYGFNKSKKYYTPIYEFDFDSGSQEIDWKPIIKMDNLGEAYLKIEKQQQDYIFYIQGFTENGDLINEIIRFD
ncbi:hypothetical protein [Formosa maritima]|uniref:Uncharacterized protein n=1 Tax=Formosa maritima TaxID=2592046 RepID=A0A5D0G888_9FLAO|nr:hypothetical protein [Formosa maritima]TYA55125.1 hypothetical protein FVF61_07640 [Formosa maritima]